MSCSKFLLIEGLNTESRGKTTVYPQTPQSLSAGTTELSSTNVEYKKQGRSELDQFHG